MMQPTKKTNLFPFEPKRTFTVEEGKVHNVPTKPTINSFEALKYLSQKSLTYFNQALTKEEKLKLIEIYKKYQRPSMTLNAYKCALVMNSLSSEQMNVLVRIHDLITRCEKDGVGSCVLLDASPGTGKTFLISALSLTLADRGLYVVYSNNLASSMAAVNNLKTMTNCKFLMDYFRISFMKAKYMWNSRYFTTIGDQLFTLVDNMRKTDICLGSEFQIVILDEYTIVSPWQILMYYLVCRLQKIVVMFSGDKNQLNSIDKTYSHQDTNFKIGRIISDDNVFKLTKFMRQDNDLPFGEKIMKITAALEDPEFFIDCKLSHKYLIFTLFPENFFKPVDYTALFLAQHHRSVTNRILNYVNNKPNDINKTMFLSYYHDSLKNVPISKFPTYLLLILNNYYIYTDSVGIKHVVQLIKIVINEEDEVVAVFIQFSNNKVLRLVPVGLSDTFMVPEHTAWLRQVATNTSRSSPLRQFPLKFFAYTYYAAQGLTLSKERIELDIDTNLNSVYVGLSRVKCSAQINRLHTEDVMSILVTAYFNDQYYYKLSVKALGIPVRERLAINVLNWMKDPNSEMIRIPELEAIQFDAVKSLAMFNFNNVTNMKILRNQNRNKQLEHKTQLMSIIELLKNDVDLLNEENKEVFVNKVNSALENKKNVN